VIIMVYPTQALILDQDIQTPLWAFNVGEVYNDERRQDRLDISKPFHSWTGWMKNRNAF
jgi:hypothetical protein